MKDQLQDNS